MTNLLIVEDSTLRAMFADPRLVQLVPCLQSSQTQLDTLKSPNCPRCEAKKRQLAASAMQAAKNCLRSLRGPQLAEVKAILGTRQLRVTTRAGSGKRVTYTF